MLGIAYYSLFLVMGGIIAEKLFKEKDIYFKIWSGGVIGNVVLMCGIMPFAFIFGFNLLSHIMLAVVTLTICLVLCDGFRFEKTIPDKKAVLIGGVIFFVTLILFENHILVLRPDGLATGQSTYGDTPMHHGIVLHILQRCLSTRPSNH